MLRTVGIGTLMAVSACASQPAAPVSTETISIDIGGTAIICIGGCMDYRVTVSSSGTLEIDNRAYRDRGRWRMSAEEFRAVAQALAPIRPGGVRRVGTPCRSLEPDECVRDYNYVVEWQGSTGASRLSFDRFQQDELHCTVYRALRVLRIEFATGRRLRRLRSDPGYCA